MATLLQLSETTILNLDAVTVLRLEKGLWRVWDSHSGQSVALTVAEMAVLELYLRNHTERRYWHDQQRQSQESPDGGR